MRREDTARMKGAVNPLTSLCLKYVEHILSHHPRTTYTVLDYGAGPGAIAAEHLQKKYPRVVACAYELPDNKKESNLFIDRDQLFGRTGQSMFDIIIFSNVFNVQTTDEEWKETIQDFLELRRDSLYAVFNFPEKPNHTPYGEEALPALMSHLFPREPDAYKLTDGEWKKVKRQYGAVFVC